MKRNCIFGIVAFLVIGIVAREALAQVPGGQPAPLSPLVGERRFAPVTGRAIYREPFALVGGFAKSFVQVEQPGAMIDVDGVPLTITGAGRWQFNGANWAIPAALVRVSRNAAGDGINGSLIERADFTGFTTMAHVINDGAEVSTIRASGFNQKKPDGTCLMFTNQDRPQLADLTDRAKATNSGHTIDASWFAVDAACAATGPTRGACIRLRGEVTDMTITGSWFGGTAAAIVLVNLPDEAWTNPDGTRGGRDNCPKRIRVVDCQAESNASKLIICYGVPLDAVQLVGTSVGCFRVVDGYALDNPGGGPSGGTDGDGTPTDHPSTPSPGLPVGIPEPQWSLWKSAEDGFVAPPANMFVDNTNANATDSSNPRGTLARPRRTIPYRLNAGDVLEIRGGPYTGNNLEMLATGTEQQPVIVRGVGLPRIEFKVSLFSRVEASRWVRFEGLDCYKWEAISANHHVVFRDGKLRNGGGFNLAGSAELGPVFDVVIANNEIHDNGDWLAEFDEDIHGGAIGARVNNVWIVGNRFWHNSGDSVQIEAGSAASQDTTHHIYVAGNEMREEKQTGGVVKRGCFVVFAGNHVHDMRPIGISPSAWGAGLGHQYGAGPVWYNGNHLHNCSFAVQSGSTSGMGTGQDAYYLFNVIHDIRHDATIDPATGKLKYAYNPNTAWSNAGFSLVGNPNKYVIGNTIINADGGIYFVGGVRLLADGNIIAGNSNQDVWLEDPTGATLEVYSNLAWPSAEYRIANQPQSWPIGNLVADPMLGANFKPLPGSPAIGAWTPSVSARSVFQRYRDTFGVSIECDATGKPRPTNGAWTIGAMQP